MKRKKSIAGRLGMAAFALTLVTTCISGGTLAKYASEVTGTGTAVTAKWAFKAGSTEGAESITTFKLGETDNSATIAKERIAPGSTGTVPLYYDLSGTEVKTNLKISIKVDDVSELPTNFKITCDGVTKGKTDFTNDTYVDFMSKDISVDTSTGVLTAADAKAQKDITWAWAFETGNDDSAKKTGNTADTADGKAANTVNFTVKVEATQLAGS
ncbi:hypothetical protein [Candidatus Stoquefichus sp. SB1]|uniref:hypothetical protein n=1 Tax=Candidatus Stoquefichus sp. SB1 TaxID=1658109 RepID=UPI00067E98C7|nr:hypothetical protein [Candidatus Stoquefichus sp. SB1]